MLPVDAYGGMGGGGQVGTGGEKQSQRNSNRYTQENGQESGRRIDRELHRPAPYHHQSGVCVHTHNALPHI